MNFICTFGFFVVTLQPEVAKIKALLRKFWSTKEQTVQANSFIHSVSIELTESGYYTLQLTNPKWTNSLVGHFQYINTAIEEVQGDERCNTKILRDGQLLIRVGERLYTPSGIQVPQYDLGIIDKERAEYST